MTREEEVQAIIKKYNDSIGNLQRNGTVKEVKFVLQYFADESNRMQRELVGLDKKQNT